MVEAKRTSREREEEKRATEPEGLSSASQRSSGEESQPGSEDPTHDEIAARAYQRWQERGSGHGAPEEDWHRAEQELRGEKARTGTKARSAAASGH